jgi:hypothetical protein
MSRKRKTLRPHPRNFDMFLVPQKASALERKSLVAQGTLEPHPCRAPFRLILRHIFRVKRIS